MKKHKKVGKINTILIILIVFANIYLTSMNLTNSKYISEFNGGGDANISNWDVVLEYNGNTITNTYEIELSGKSENNGKIVPGSTGSFPITIDATRCNTTMPIKYEIKMSKNSNVPANMEFYINNVNTIITNETYTGTMTGGSISSEIIYWRWIFNNADEDKYQNTDFSLILEVTVYSN